MDNNQCVHLILGCCHDGGYAPFLGQLVAKKSNQERVTLLEVQRMPVAIQELRQQGTQFSKVFHSGFGRVESTGSGSGSRSVGESVGIVAKVLPSGPKEASRSGSYGGGGSGAERVQAAGQQQLRRMIVNEKGQRVDRFIQVNEAMVEHVKKAQLCGHYYLRGNCSVKGCKQNHLYRELNEAEFEGLSVLMRRQGKCYKMGQCRDEQCIYRHIAGS